MKSVGTTKCLICQVRQKLTEDLAFRDERFHESNNIITALHAESNQLFYEYSVHIQTIL